MLHWVRFVPTLTSSHIHVGINGSSGARTNRRLKTKSTCVTKGALLSRKQIINAVTFCNFFDFTNYGQLSAAVRTGSQWNWLTSEQLCDCQRAEQAYWAEWEDTQTQLRGARGQDGRTDWLTDWMTDWLTASDSDWLIPGGSSEEDSREGQVKETPGGSSEGDYNRGSIKEDRPLLPSGKKPHDINPVIV
jgi:hypothetical protein